MKQEQIRKQKQNEPPDFDRLPRRKGRAELKRHMEGGKISMQAAVRAKCYDCMGYFIDGAIDCDDERCPLYHWMPYRYKPAYLAN